MSTPSRVVTALMPVKHYHAGFLRAAVQSMFEQTCPDWRLLVIVEPPDRDEIAAVLADELRDPRIETAISHGRQLAGALNAGMRAARTDFVAILLGDDTWAPEAVEVLARNFAEHPEADFFHSARRAIDADGEPLSKVLPCQLEVSLEDFARLTSPVKHILCWRREFALSIGGMDESLNSVGVDDFDFPWTMAEYGAAFHGMPECLYVYRDHRDDFRLTTHLPLSHHKREMTRILRKHGTDRERIARFLEEAEQGFMRQCLYRSRWDRFVKRLRGLDVRAGWREPYS
jgi:glycosyltransferase involved in cell wall biosynthesis